MDDHQRLAANPNWGISPDEATIQEQDIEIVRLRTEMGAAHSLNARLGRELDNLRTENETLRKQLEEAWEARDQYLHSNVKLKDEILSLRKRYEETDKSCYDLAQRNLELRKRVAELEAQNADLRRWKALDKPLTAATAVANISAQAHRARAEQAEKRVAELEAQLAKTDVAYCDAIVRAEVAEAQLATVTKRRSELASQCVDSDERIEELEVQLAIAQTSPATTPVGMVLVPIDPTKEMLDAAWADALAEDAAGVWKSMIATSPPVGRDET